MYPIVRMMDVSPQGEIAYVKFKPGENELWLADFSKQLTGRITLTPFTLKLASGDESP